MAPSHPRRFSPRRWPVRWRIAVVSSGLTLVILVCFALVVGRLATNRIKDDFQRDVQATANQLAADFPLNDPRNLFAAGDGLIRLVYSDGAPVLDGAGNPLPGLQQNAQLGPPEISDVIRVGQYAVASQQVLAFTSQLSEPVYIQYAKSHHAIDRTVDRLWLFLVGGVAGGTILALLAGLAVASRAMRPIAGLTAAAREITATRDPSRRLPTTESEDEVAELGRTLDQMLRELDAARGETQQMMQAQRDFVADASHELRTPLTSILANLELLEASFAARGADPDEEEIVAGALGSSKRMRRLVSDLLLLARADAGRGGARRACDLAEIAASALGEVRPVADGHALALEAPEPVTVDGNPDDLHRLILNLLENGVRHTPRGTSIAVSVAARDGHAVLEVADDGPGIPPQAGDQLFSRFVRVGGAADLVVDSGTGLGLAIVKAVAASHGGDVTAGSSRVGGARFVVRLPLREHARAVEPSPVESAAPGRSTEREAEV
ncbi:MAG: HAMP domain-containing protein [Solirubrobacterales bacterium]|nr:HAMP domain-containing protein [Solirubrobacterales bacterium]